MRSIRHKVRDAVGYDNLYSLEEKIRALNPILRGWRQYFRIGNAHRHFKKVDSYVYTKLVNFLSRKHKLRGKGFRALPPSFFKMKAGLYQLRGTVVHRFRTPRGEHGRDDRNGPVRFDEGALDWLPSPFSTNDVTSP